jgi:DoxX
MRAEKKCKWLRPLRRKSRLRRRNFGARSRTEGGSYGNETNEPECWPRGAADAGQDERHNSRSLAARQQEWAPIALRVPLGMIFFAHDAQKMFGWFGGDGWNGTMQYFTQSLHIPARLAAVAILVELLGGLALLAFTRWTAILERGILSSGW